MGKQKNTSEESNSNCSVKELNYSNCIVSQQLSNTSDDKESRQSDLSDDKESRQSDLSDEDSNGFNVSKKITVREILNSDLTGEVVLSFLFGMIEKIKNYLKELEHCRQCLLNKMDLVNATKDLTVLQNVLLQKGTSNRTVNKNLAEDNATEQVPEFSEKIVSKNSLLNEPQTSTPKKFSKKIKDGNFDLNSSEKRSFKSTSPNESPAKFFKKLSKKIDDVCSNQKIPEKRSLKCSSRDALPAKYSKKIDYVDSEPKFFEKKSLRSSLGNESPSKKFSNNINDVNSDENISEKKSTKTLNSNRKSNFKNYVATSSDEYESDIEQTKRKPYLNKPKSLAEITKSEPTTSKSISNFEKHVKMFEKEYSKYDTSPPIKTKEGKKINVKLEMYEKAKNKATTSGNLNDDSEGSVNAWKQSLDKINKNSKRIAKTSPKSKKEVFRKNLQNNSKGKTGTPQGQQTLNDANNVNTGRRTSLRLQNKPKDNVNIAANKLAYFSSPPSISATDFIKCLTAAGKSGKKLYLEIEKRLPKKGQISKN